MSDLMEFLLRNRENKGVMATLRRALVENTEMRAWPLLAKFGGIGSSPRARAVRTVAGLFAYHPEHCETGNMGTVCRALCSSEEQPWSSVDEQGKASSPGPVARKFMYLLSANREEICERVARVVLYAKSQGIRVNYGALEQDLEKWPRAREAWAGIFWASPQADDQQNEQEETA